MKQMKINEMRAVWNATKGEGLEFGVGMPITGLVKGFSIILRARKEDEHFWLITDRNEIREFRTIEAMKKAMESISGGKVDVRMKINVDYD